MPISLATRTMIKTTTSLCPRCRRMLPAEVYAIGERVFLGKRCPEHGPFEVLISSDRRFYYLSTGSGGAGAACGCGPQGCGAGAVGGEKSGEEASPGGRPVSLAETAATCIALIEIVTSCNMKCPTCYADSPFTPPASVDALPLDEFWRRIESVIARKGPIDILQLSGGEPTIHPQFFELLEGVLRDKRIGYALLNTNGLRIAGDQDFADRLGELHRRYKRFELYLQYDGQQQAGQAELRGGDFRGVRRRAIDRAGDHGLPTTLAMTVQHDNVFALGDALRFGLAHPSVRGMTLQPMFHSGRTPAPAPAPGTGSAPGIATAPSRPPQHLNVADMVLGLIDQSEGLLTTADFTPLPCGDPNCHTIGYVLRRGGELIPVSRLVDFATVQGFLKDRINFNLKDLAKCGCEAEPLGSILKSLEIGPESVFRIFIKPFMDAWTYDQDRIDRCCVHVIGAEGKLESFCRHYAMRG